MNICPNYQKLNEALGIYRSCMRGFIILHLKKTWGLDVEDLVIESLGDAGLSKRVDEICDRLEESDADIKSIIDIGDFPHLLQRNWNEIFREPLNYDKTIRNQLWLIRDVRNIAAHPSEADAEPEWTRTHLSLIADVLGKVNNPDAKQRVEVIRDKLFADDTPERLAEVEKQLAEKDQKIGTLTSENTDLESKSTQLQQSLAAAEAENQPLKDELETQTASEKELKKELKEAKDKVLITSKQLSETQVQLATLTSENDDLKSENAQLQESCETELNLRQIAEQNLEIQRRQTNKTTNRLAEAKEQLAGTKQRFSHTQASLANFTSKITELQQSLETTQRYNHEFEERILSESNRRQTAEQNLEAQRRQTHETANRLAAAKAQLATLTSENTALQNSLQIAEAALEAQRTQTNETTYQLFVSNDRGDAIRALARELDTTYGKVQKALRAIYRGDSDEDAARISGLDIEELREASGYPAAWRFYQAKRDND